MPCSAVTLSIATICAIIATALLAIAFSTDNWLHYDVRRNQIQVSVKRQQNDTDDSHISRLSHLASSISFAHAHAFMYVCVYLTPPPNQDKDNRFKSSQGLCCYRKTEQCIGRTRRRSKRSGEQS